jgi:predicted amidohydrolase
MVRTLKIAAVQMDAVPAPCAERLTRAADLVAEAAGAGAQLVVLPELFNVGYAYIDALYDAVETLDGMTAGWMKAQAAQHHIHLAGTLLVREGDEVYNSALLFAPDGRMWRYDKRYPCGWERAFFRERKDQITVAETSLGKLGLMICWDLAHPDSWRDYAGKVDAMVIPSCPPDLPHSVLSFPDGQKFHMEIRTSHFADQDIHDQTAWLGIPAVHSSGGGAFTSPMPLPHLSVFGFLAGRPAAWGRIFQARSALLEAAYKHHTQIIDSHGQVVGRVTEEGDGFTIAEVELPESPRQPDQPQPRMRTSNLAFWINDKIIPFAVRARYRSMTRRESYGIVFKR